MKKHKFNIRKYLRWPDSPPNIPVQDLPVTECPNCRYSFQGHFCPNCGQQVAEFDQPFGFVFYDFLGNFFAFDSRFLKSFTGLFKPGFLTVEFFKGRRASYAPPFRIFIFLSFLLFLFGQILTNRAIHSISGDIELSAGKDTLASVTGLPINQLPDSVQTASLNQLGQVFSVKSNSTDPDDIRQVEQIKQAFKDPANLANNVLKYLSWSFFILLPIFALILKIFYIRHHIHYVRHLIFSIHLHASFFLILIVPIALRLLSQASWTLFSLWLLWLIPIYLYVAMKVFYMQSYSKTFVKFLGISALYTLCC
jgi:hypothetical protein